MVRSTKLKVYRTPIGFHDAYVAAASQKAALEAWGSDSNLFAQKAAEIVTDPALMAEPLEKPGVVIKRMRGTVAEQIAALGPDVPKPKKRVVDDVPKPPAEPKPKPKSEPRPDRAALTKAEEMLADVERRHRDEQKKMREEEAALLRARRELDKAQRVEIEKLDSERTSAEAAYESAMQKWRG